jgi:hypothetical protein
MEYALESIYMEFTQMTTMPGNIFEAAFQNIRKGKVFSIINILGLRYEGEILVVAL